MEVLKEKKSLVLKNDFYSLAFYGFYLDTDQEELSAHNDAESVSIMMKKATMSTFKEKKNIEE